MLLSCRYAWRYHRRRRRSSPLPYGRIHGGANIARGEDGRQLSLAGMIGAAACRVAKRLRMACWRRDACSIVPMMRHRRHA